MDQKLAKTREQFIEQIGLVAQDEGLPRIAGRLIGLMVFDGCAYSFAELAEKLQVSRGSISTNARLLEDRGILEKVGKPGDRQDYYQLSRSPYTDLIAGAAMRARKAQSIISRTVREIPGDQTAILGRILSYEGFYSLIAEKLEEATTELKTMDDSG